MGKVKNFEKRQLGFSIYYIYEYVYWIYWKNNNKKKKFDNSAKTAYDRLAL